MKKGLPAWATLALISLVAGLLLGFTNELTAPTIEEQNRIQAEAARRSVLPQAEEFEEIQLAADSGLDSCYAGKAAGQIVGYVAQVTTRGYGGEIEVITGVDLSGTIAGISVGGANFSETMGLGSKAREPEFTDQFAGITAPVALGDNVDAITSATITSAAVVSAVNIACDYIDTLQG